MDLNDFGRVAAAAVLSITDLLGDWFPNGVIDGSEFCIGSASGEAGKSMRIRLTGAKAGYWSDFSDGEAGLDLISLYAFIHGISNGKACAALARQLGIELTPDPNWKGPQRPGIASQAAKEPAPAPARQGVDAPASFPDSAAEESADPADPVQKESAPAPARQGVEEKKLRSEWEPVLPVPDNAGPYPVAHFKRGRPEKIWEYRDQSNRLLGVVYRFVTSDGGKAVLPCVYARRAKTGECKWHWITWREPRPLYLHGLLRPELEVVVVEGEKCADAGFAHVGDRYDIVSWSGGGKAVSKSDWEYLRGRHVVLWADADAKRYPEKDDLAGQIMPENEQPGMSAMRKLADILLKLECTVEFVDIPPPGVKPDGWDIADLIAEGATDDDIVAWINKRRSNAPAVPDVPLDEAPDEPAPRPEPDFDIPGWVVEQPVGISTAPLAGAKILTWDELYGLLIKTDRNTVKGCRENAYMVLSQDPKLIGLVALDQFSQLQMKRREAPWKSEPGEWTESDDFNLGLYLSKRYYCTIASIGEIEKAVSQAAREHAFDPVKDYLTECADNWDRVQRVENAFSVYWGADESDYMRLISTMFFVGLVMRGFKPGVKHDCAPVFEGGQGEGKSSALAALGGEWFADTPFRMGEKDGYLSIQGILIYEIAELEQFNRSEVTAVKAFMSSSKDRYREPYGRRLKNVPRRTCFAATTNEKQYFKDPTGNRRFWPLTVGNIDLKNLAIDRDQLLGEAVHMMRAGVLWYPTRDQQRSLIDPMQSDREIPHEWTGRLYEYCEGLDADGKPIFGSRLDRVSSRELLTKCLHIEIGKLSAVKRETMDVAACMRKLGWTKEREKGGAREYYFVRPAAKVLPNPELETEGDDDLPL